MRIINVLVILFFSLLIITCSQNKEYSKGFYISPESEFDTDPEASEYAEVKGVRNDSVILKTRPGNVLLTGHDNYRLTPVYKLNYSEKHEYYYTGSNHFHRNWDEIGYTEGNQWNCNFLPGLQAVYGFNMVNVSLYDARNNRQEDFFDKPVLVKTLYYPSFSNDTLANQPVTRNYYMISVYDEDTNKDGFVNPKDLRRFYYFDLDGQNKLQLIPTNFSVISSDYDRANDFMFVYAKLDENKNGQSDETENIHVFWIDLKNPKHNGKLY